jgi:hypothetical protein
LLYEIKGVWAGFVTVTILAEKFPVTRSAADMLDT